jgi:agmatinase
LARRSRKQSARDAADPAPAEEVPAKPPTLSGEPRYARVPSFFGLKRYEPTRRVPPVDVLLCGLPYDGGVLHRPGARYGPQAVREASLGLGGFSEALGIDVHEELAVADGGDVAPNPHDMDGALAAISARAEAIARSGVVGGFVGGDQTVTLGALRGIHRAKPRSVGFIHFDAWSDTLGPAGKQDTHHHSVLRKLLDEGLIRPDATVQIGIRGPSRSQSELQFPVAQGFEIIKVDDVKWDIYSAVGQLRKMVRKGSVYVSVDVSALDPSCAPGIASPKAGGMNSWELQQLIRALVGVHIVGFDVVEVAPPYDHGGITAQAAATALHEILAVLADTRRSAQAAPSSGGSRRRGHKRWSP